MDTAEYWRSEFEGMKVAFEEYAASSKNIEAELELEIDAVGHGVNQSTGARPCLKCPHWLPHAPGADEAAGGPV